MPFLLRDQYIIGEDDNEQRIDALAEAARLTFDALLSGVLPEPVTLARDLGPLDERAPAADVERRAGGTGPARAGAHGGADPAARRRRRVVGDRVERGGQQDRQLPGAPRPVRLNHRPGDETTATLRVELTNTAPAEGLPPYVIGNRIGAPAGTSRLYVSFYSPLALTGVTLDGEATGLAVGREAGWNVYSRLVDIPPGGTVTFELQLAGTVSNPDELVTWEQPMASPLQEAG